MSDNIPGSTWWGIGLSWGGIDILVLLGLYTFGAQPWGLFLCVLEVAPLYQTWKWIAVSINYNANTHITYSLKILPEEFGPLQILLASPIRKTHDDIWLIDGLYVELCDPEVIIAGHEKCVKCEKFGCSQWFVEIYRSSSSASTSRISPGRPRSFVRLW